MKSSSQLESSSQQWCKVHDRFHGISLKVLTAIPTRKGGARTGLYNLDRAKTKTGLLTSNKCPSFSPSHLKAPTSSFHTNLTTSELTTTRPQLPSLVSHFNLKNHSQHPQPLLITHGSRKSIHPQTVLPVWGVELRFTWAHLCTEATDLLI